MVVDAATQRHPRMARVPLAAIMAVQDRTAASVADRMVAPAAARTEEGVLTEAIAKV